MFCVHSGKDAYFYTLVVVGNSRYFIVYRITAEQNPFRISDMAHNGQNGFRLKVYSILPLIVKRTIQAAHVQIDFILFHTAIIPERKALENSFIYAASRWAAYCDGFFNDGHASAHKRIEDSNAREVVGGIECIPGVIGLMQIIASQPQNA